MNYLLEVLQGGDLRSDGHADEVAGDVIQDPALFPHFYTFLNLFLCWAISLSLLEHPPIT